MFIIGAVDQMVFSLQIIPPQHLIRFVVNKLDLTLFLCGLFNHRKITFGRL